MKRHSLQIALLLSLLVLALAVPAVFAAPGPDRGQPGAPADADPQHSRTVLLEGRVTAVSSDGFTLQHGNGRALNVHVSNTTVYVPLDYRPAVNDQVEVLALKREDNTYDAIVVLKEERRPERVELHGTIVSVPDNPGYVGTWTIMPVATTTSVEIKVTEKTQINPRHLTPRVGDHVWVRALRIDDRLVAEEIKLERRTDEGVRIEFRGPIRSLPEGSGPGTNWAGDWVIGGMTVTVATDTAIVGTPVVGAMADVEALAQKQEGHRTLTATKIVIMPEREQRLELRGMVQEVATDRTFLKIAGYQIGMNGDTRVYGSLKEGVMARVEMIAQAGGFLARSVHVERRGGDSDKVRLRGVITAVADDKLTFSGIEVKVTPETHKKGTPAVGLWAVVQATYAEGVGLTATEVYVLEHTEDD